MRPGSPDPARRAVERIAATVGPPLPPEGLHASGRRPRVSQAALAIAAVLVLLVVSLAMLRLTASGRPAAGSPSDLVVVEHLRVNGRAVPSRVVDLPAAGAVIVLPGAVSRGRVEGKAPADHRIAALSSKPGEDVHHR